MSSDVRLVNPSLDQRKAWASFARGLSVPGLLAGIGVPIVQALRGKTIWPSVAPALDVVTVIALLSALLAPLCAFIALFVAIVASLPPWAEAWRFRSTWRDVFIGILGTIVAWVLLLPEFLRD